MPRVCANRPSNEILINQYLVDLLSTNDLAKIYQTCNGTIARWLRLAGVQIRTNSEARKLAAKKRPLLKLQSYAICQHCKKQFIVKHPGNPNIFCSTKCLYKSRPTGPDNPTWKPKIILTCETCGIQFEMPPYKIKTRRFCSKDCDTKWRQTLTGSTRYNFKGPPKPMACEICGTVKMVRSAFQKRFRACSRQCAAELGRRASPRVSSIEKTMAVAFFNIGLSPQAQYPIDRVSVDFAFPENRLAVECDGDYWHNLPGKPASDNRKDWFLRNLGWRVIRLTETDIKANPEACALRIKDSLDRHAFDDVSA